MDKKYFYYLIILGFAAWMYNESRKNKQQPKVK